jgi:hypothetical protein
MSRTSGKPAAILPPDQIVDLFHSLPGDTALKILVPASARALLARIARRRRDVAARPPVPWKEEWMTSSNLADHGALARLLPPFPARVRDQKKLP